MRSMALVGIGLWTGMALLLAQLRWFRRPALADRLRPYSPGSAPPSRVNPWSVESFSEAIGPLAGAVGERLSSVLGIQEDLALRLERVHSPLDATEFRVRQLGAAVGATAVSALVAVGLRLPPAMTGALLLGAPLLAFLVVEQRLRAACQRWQRRLFLELPVVCEQLAMLVSAGYSLGAALNRVAQRGNGACATDLARVASRVRHGLTETQALEEWAEVARVEALDRLVPVLALNREANDLGQMLSAEARAIRRDVQREVVEIMESRGQKVWIPVTVATLVPGVIFLSIPFIEALSLFSGS